MTDAVAPEASGSSRATSRSSTTRCRPGSGRTARPSCARYAELLGREFDVVDAGMLTSDAEGDAGERAAARAAARTSSSSRRRWRPRRATPRVRWPASTRRSSSGTGRRSTGCPDGLTQAQATVNSSQVAAVMLANALVRERRPFATITASPADAGRRRAPADRTVRAAAAASRLRGSSVLRVGAPFPGYLDVEAGPPSSTRLGVTEREVTRRAS